MIRTKSCRCVMLRVTSLWIRLTILETYNYFLFYFICIFYSTRMNLRAKIMCNQYGRTFKQVKCCRFDEKSWKFKWRTSFWILFEYGRICKVVVEKFIAIVSHVSPIYLWNQARWIIIRVVCISFMCNKIRT